MTEGLDPLRPYLRLDSPDDDAVLPPFPPAVSIQISVDRFGPALCSRGQSGGRLDVVVHRRRCSYWGGTLPVGLLGPAGPALQLDGPLDCRDRGVWRAHHADRRRLAAPISTPDRPESGSFWRSSMRSQATWHLRELPWVPSTVRSVSSPAFLPRRLPRPSLSIAATWAWRTRPAGSVC